MSIRTLRRFWREVRIARGADTATVGSSPGLEGEVRRLKLLVNSTMDDASFMLDPDGRIKSWYAGAELLLGYTADEAVGQSFSIFHPPDSRADGLPERELEQAAAGGRFETEGWRVRKDGSSFWADALIGSGKFST